MRNVYRGRKRHLYIFSFVKTNRLDCLINKNASQLLLLLQSNFRQSEKEASHLYSCQDRQGLIRATDEGLDPTPDHWRPVSGPPSLRCRDRGGMNKCLDFNCTSGLGKFKAQRDSSKLWGLIQSGIPRDKHILWVREGQPDWQGTKRGH